MSRTRFLLVPLTFVVIIGLLIIGGWAVHRIGWSEGYRMAQLAAAGEAGATVPYAPYGFGFLRLFLMAGLIVLVVVMIGKIFRFWAWKTVAGPWMMAGAHWKMAGGPKDERWARHWHRHYHPMHPWCWEKPSEERSEQAEPDADAGNAESAS